MSLNASCVFDDDDDDDDDGGGGGGNDDGVGGTDDADRSGNDDGVSISILYTTKVCIASNAANLNGLDKYDALNNSMNGINNSLILILLLLLSYLSLCCNVLNATSSVVLSLLKPKYDFLNNDIIIRHFSRAMCFDTERVIVLVSYIYVITTRY